MTVPGKNFEKELQKSAVTEIAQDVWLLEGFIGDKFFREPPSSNIYIFRDGDSLLILDTGTHQLYRQRMLDIIKRYKAEGVKRITLMLTQGHFDHASNNTVVLESGLEWRFLLPEPEVQTINFFDDALKDFHNLEEYYDVYSTMFPWGGETAPIRMANTLSPRLARRAVKFAFGHLFNGIQTLADKAEILSLESRVTKRIGTVELTGWEVGRFFAIHDASHTPGHISLYDPENKLLISGDVTIEINPAFFYSSVDKCQEACGWFRQMAEEGNVVLAGDSHRSKTFFPELFDRYGMEALHPIELADIAQGRDRCVDFFSMFENYYKELKNEVLSAHSRTGEATVAEILEELLASRAPSVRLKKAMQFPQFPSRMDVLVAKVLKDAGVTPRHEGKRIVLAPVTA
ncbi:MAG: hypothetical protein AVO39_10865 [delta proteobacterium MLS_D]|jgi:glyoxylase-like metal-dependent hydrolase (beta-lactamase superfamily II)|nr:MAG: hypothetical protein AVO39_10865 [delta proteobacterium MLS_D]